MKVDKCHLSLDELSISNLCIEYSCRTFCVLSVWRFTFMRDVYWLFSCSFLKNAFIPLDWFIHIQFVLFIWFWAQILHYTRVWKKKICLLCLPYDVITGKTCVRPKLVSTLYYRPLDLLWSKTVHWPPMSQSGFYVSVRGGDQCLQRHAKTFN